MLNYIEKYRSKEPRTFTRTLQKTELFETFTTSKKTATRHFVCFGIQLIDVNIMTEKIPNSFIYC